LKLRVAGEQGRGLCRRRDEVRILAQKYAECPLQQIERNELRFFKLGPTSAVKAIDIKSSALLHDAGDSGEARRRIAAKNI